MMWQARKAHDLLRDDRILVHSIATTREGTEGEVKVRGRAIAVDDREVLTRHLQRASRRLSSNGTSGEVARTTVTLAL